MGKLQDEYDRMYGHIPKDLNSRLEFIKKKVKTDRGYAGILVDEIKRIKSIQWKTISFVIYLVPKATPRPRRSKNGVFYVAGAADNKRFFKEFSKTIKKFIFIATPCKFYCTSYLPIPSDMKILYQLLAEMGYIRPVGNPDFDNLAKTYADMIQGTLLLNDAIVVDGMSRKFYSVKPRIEIKIQYMADYDSDYTRKKIERQLDKIKERM